MLQTDGHIQVYGIFRGKLQRADRPKSEQHITCISPLGWESSLLRSGLQSLIISKQLGAMRPTSIPICVERPERGSTAMNCREPITGTVLCQQCGGTIEEGRLRNQPPTEAKYCRKCRSDRRRRANLKYVWRPEYDDYLNAHYYGGLNRRFQVLNRMMRETGLPR